MYFFQAGVLFSKENTKFLPILAVLSQIYALFGHFYFKKYGGVPKWTIIRYVVLRISLVVPNEKIHPKSITAKKMAVHTDLDFCCSDVTSPYQPKGSQCQIPDRPVSFRSCIPEEN